MDTTGLTDRVDEGAFMVKSPAQKTGGRVASSDARDPLALKFGCKVGAVLGRKCSRARRLH